MHEHPFGFLPFNAREEKPRRRGLTEIRGPYYTPLGRHYLQDLLEAISDAVDALKFAGGSFTLIRAAALRDLIDLAHSFGVAVSTGGFIERVLPLGPPYVDRYIAACADSGFDVIEISSGFVTTSIEDRLRLAHRIMERGLKVKAEIGIQFGAGGGTATDVLQAAGTRDVRLLIDDGRRFLSEGVDMLMIESEGITENVAQWRTDVPSAVAAELGLTRVMFEAADPSVFEWYVQTFGAEVNLFVDHSQIVQLEALRRGIWGTAWSWGRVATYKE